MKVDSLFFLKHSMLFLFALIVLLLLLFMDGCAVKYETGTNSSGVSATTYEGRVLTDVRIWGQIVTMYDSFTQLFQSTPPTSTAPPEQGGGGSSVAAEKPPIIEPQPAAPETPTVEPQKPTAQEAYTLTGREVVITWKPVSEGDRKLVVIPNESYGNVAVSLNGEKGNFVGRANGNRPHYRFKNPGKNYPDPSFLQVDGRKFVVTSPAKRHETLKEIK